MVACKNTSLSGDRAKKGDQAQEINSAGYNSSSLFIYDLFSPDQRIILPPILTEISGICTYDSGRLAGVQDEQGRVFIFRINDGKIEYTYNFAEDGDYEDITMAHKFIYVLKSNGDIYRIDPGKSGKNGITRFQTRLRSRNDCEGLTYVPHLDALLIACKGSPSLDKHDPPGKYKAIYKFLFQTADIDTVPFLIINTDEIGLDEPKDWYQGISIKLANQLSQYGNIAFQPSGIACHPVTHHYYILAHVGKVIIVASQTGEILQILPIDPAILRQPEGICFSDDGTLYIASEGAGTDPVLAVFRAKKDSR